MSKKFTILRTTKGFFWISSKMARRSPAKNWGTPSMAFTPVSCMLCMMSGPFRLFRYVTVVPWESGSTMQAMDG